MGRKDCAVYATLTLLLFVRLFPPLFFFQKFKLKNRQFQARYVREKFYSFYSVRACLHGGGGPQVGEVTRLGGVTRLSIYSLILI